MSTEHNSRLEKLVPNHPAAVTAFAQAKVSLPPAVFNHSFRVFLYAQAFAAERLSPEGLREHPAGISRVCIDDDGESTNEDIPLHVLFVAALMHDFGCAPCFATTNERFEVTGADAAAAILRAHRASDAKSDQQESSRVAERHIRSAWLAIALHTSINISERLDGTVRILRLAVKADFHSDFKPLQRYMADNLTMADTEALLPRLDAEIVLSNAVVAQILQNPLKAPKASWPADLLRGYEEEPHSTCLARL
ncbi:hypothetical protein HK100_007118, partial [Physocladia obscura]